MESQCVVVRSDDPRQPDLLGNGWVVVARSWGALLTDVDEAGLRDVTSRRSGDVVLRPIASGDLDQVLALDRATIGDYPGGPATAHRALTRTAAEPTETRRGFGAFLPEGRLVAMTYLEINNTTAETDFTVVARDQRLRGRSEAVKAAAVLALHEEGITSFRSGGSAQNPAIFAANAALGYIQDEEWLTYAPLADDATAS
jgi:hypothetical protein